ncbi:MAG: hypothetical protein IJ566_03325 [Cardiobacteriaceae bacterium]|nr:hypothetical protein [Cardiobacteriaceae bacterium]
MGILDHRNGRNISGSLKELYASITACLVGKDAHPTAVFIVLFQTA